MMKRILLGASLLLLTSTVHAQINVDTTETDSLVRIIGWFNKTDTLEYAYNLVVAEVVNGDTTIVNASGNEFRICVIDSTKNGYVMEYVPTDVWSSDTTSVQGEITLLAARKALGFKTRFSTDEMGSFREIINWKEVYKNVVAIQDKCINQIFFEHPELYAHQNIDELKKKLKENAEKMCGSKEKATEMFANLGLLFNFHGRELPVGESTLEKDGVSYYYQAHAGALEDEEDSNEYEYQLYCEIKQKEDDGSLISYHYDYAYFDDGWPRSVTATVVEEQEGKTILTQHRIDWVYKAW
jgi:hypothetical protein